MNVLITGSSSGLGLSLCDKLNEMGHNVYGLSRSETPLDIKQSICDFKDITSIGQCLRKLVGNDNIDCVFLNAGMLGNISKINEVSVGDFDEILKVNLLSNKVILDYLIVNNSIKNVIGISSGAANKVYYGWSLYCVSKSAFKQLLSVYAEEYKDIMFLSLAPGIIKSKMQNDIKNVDVELIPSVKKFHDMYEDMDSPDVVAGKIIDNMSTLLSLDSGSYFDLRSL